MDLVDSNPILFRGQLFCYFPKEREDCLENPKQQKQLLCLLLCRQILYHLSHHVSPKRSFIFLISQLRDIFFF